MAESEGKEDRFKTVIAILIAVVSLIAAVGGARAGFVATDDNELTRTGLINKAREARYELSQQLVAANQLAVARQYIEARETASLTRSDALESRQQGLEADAVSLEARSVAAQDSADVLANRTLYTSYLTPKDNLDTQQMLNDLKQGIEAREYRSLRPQSYLDRGDARGEIGIRTMWALAIMSLSLVFLGVAEMIEHKSRYALVAAGLVVVGISVWMMVKA